MPCGSKDTPCASSGMPGETPEGSGETPGRGSEASREPGEASGEPWEARGRTRKGACTWHAPREDFYLLLGGGVARGAGAGVPNAGAGVVGGTTVALGRVRSGWMPNSTSLSLPLP